MSTPIWCSTSAGAAPPVGDWLVEAGCRPPVVENHNVGIAYFSRWYSVRPGGPANPGRVWDISVTPFAIGLVFPSDNDIFAVTLAMPVSDPTRAALRDPAVFDSRRPPLPRRRAWLALEPEAVGDVQMMAGLDNRWTALVDERGPVVTGLVGVGDSITHTNPTLGQGVALALLAAQRVASTVRRLRPGASQRDYHDWAVRTLKPWFDHQVTVDRGDEAFLSGASIRTRSRRRSTTRPGRSSPRPLARWRIRWSCGRGLRSAISCSPPTRRSARRRSARTSAGGSSGTRSSPRCRPGLPARTGRRSPATRLGAVMS